MRTGGEEVSYNFRADPILGRALAYWDRRRGGRAMPRRADIDPVDIPQLLPNLQLIEVSDGGRRFRYRLVGTALVTAFGAEYTGKFLDELFDGVRLENASRVLRAVVSGSVPIFLRNSYGTTKTVEMVANRLYMPLSEDGGTVSRIFGALTFEFGSPLAAQGGWGGPEMKLLESTQAVAEPVLPVLMPMQ